MVAAIYKVVGIDSGAFEDCSSLTGVIIPNSVTSIGDHAFNGCIPQSIYIEDGITPLKIINNLEHNGFGSSICCKELYIGRNLIASFRPYGRFWIDKTEKVTFSQFVTSVDDIGMDSAEGLKTVISRGRIPLVIADDFFSVDQYNNATLYVPEGAMQAYMEAQGWRYFYNIVEGLPTGISQVEATDDGMAVTADNGYIAISNAHGKVNVYDASGTMIGTAAADGGDVRMPVPGKGLYIVKAGGTAVKIAM